LQLGHRCLKLRRDQGKGLVLHSQRLVEINTFGNQVSIEIVELRGKEGCEIFWNFVTLLKAGAKAVGEGRDIGNVIVLSDFGFLLHVTLELGLPVLAEQPLENGLLNLLVILILEEFVCEEFH
jgi:hypothetical protein